LDACAISHLGAVVNFAAGSVGRAPPWVRRCGLEWLWRIKEEPSLWRRYWNDAVTVGGMLARDLLPLWWQQWRARGHRGSLASQPIVHSSRKGDVLRIEMAGVFRVADLGPLRAAFTEAVQANADIELDLRAARQIDSATIALIQLLAAHQIDAGRRLRLLEVGEALRRQFRCYRVEGLLSESNPAAASLHAS
jgi:N-acetylglucosaminyldiphosphoundecaprenol N-acetyl-beta-D-mannosaminyltransferase